MNGTQRWQEKLDCLFFEGRYDQTIVCERVRKTDCMFSLVDSRSIADQCSRSMIPAGNGYLSTFLPNNPNGEHPFHQSTATTRTTTPQHILYTHRLVPGS